MQVAAESGASAEVLLLLLDASGLDGAALAALTAGGKPMLYHLLETTRWCSEDATESAEAAVLKPLADANPRLWLQRAFAAADAFPATAARLINAGVNMELLLLAAADEEHLGASQHLVAEHGATGTPSQPDGRSAAEVGARLPDAEARLFFGSLGSYLGRYKREVASQYESATCSVWFAADVQDSSRKVALKIMRSADGFEREMKARDPRWYRRSSVRARSSPNDVREPGAEKQRCPVDREV